MEIETIINIDAPILASHNTFLQDLSTAIRLKSVPWEGYQRASLISEQELVQIRLFEQPQTTQKQPGTECIQLYLSLLGKLTRVDTIQSILVLLDDFLELDSDRVESFQHLSTDTYPYSCFFKYSILNAAYSVKMMNSSSLNRLKYWFF
jgi:V-type H+-transporting ATPase subunit H